MGSEVEGDELARHARIHDDRHPEAVPERRHRAQFAVGEQLGQFGFIRQPDIDQSEQIGESVQIQQLTGRKDCHSKALLAEVNDRLGKLVHRHLIGAGSRARRPGRGVNRMRVRNPTLVGVFKPAVNGSNIFSPAG